MTKASRLYGGMKFKLAGNTCTVERVRVDETYSTPERPNIIRVEYNYPLGDADAVFGFLVVHRDTDFDIVNDADPRYTPQDQWRIRDSKGGIRPEQFVTQDSAQAFLYLGGEGAKLERLYKKKPMYLWKTW